MSGEINFGISESLKDQDETVVTAMRRAIANRDVTAIDAISPDSRFGVKAGDKAPGKETHEAFGVEPGEVFCVADLHTVVGLGSSDRLILHGLGVTSRAVGISRLVTTDTLVAAYKVTAA